MVETKVKTKSVTNTQLATAVLAAFLAGGLAFAAAPAANKNAAAAPKCGVNQMSLKTKAGCAQGTYASVSFSCQDGTKKSYAPTKCMAARDLQAYANTVCAKKCVPVEKPPAAPAKPAAPATSPEIPPVDDNDENIARDLPDAEAGLPDLVITALQLTPQADGNVSYQLDYANQGTRDAHGPFYFSFIAQDQDSNEIALQLNQITSGEYPQENIDGTYLGPKFFKDIFPPLPNGAGTMNGTIPRDLIQRGMRTFWVKIDHGERVSESVENNNKMNASIPEEAIQIVAAPVPAPAPTSTPGMHDFVVEFVTSSFRGNGDLNYSLTIRNRGTERSRQTTASVELLDAQGNVLDNGNLQEARDRGVQLFMIDPLDIGQSQDRSGSFFASAINRGAVRIRVIAAPYRALGYELSDNNNEMIIDIPPRLALPDLSIDEVSLQRQENGDLSYSVTVRNIGEGRSTLTNLSIGLVDAQGNSLDNWNIADSRDRGLGLFYIDPLEGGEAQTRAYYFYASAVERGAVQVRVRVDADNTMPETNDSNNELFRNIP